MRTEPWPLEPPQVRRLLERLSLQLGKWDMHQAGDPTVLPDFLVLGAEEHRALVRRAQTARAAQCEMEEAVRTQPACLEAVGVPAELCEVVATAPAPGPRLTRCDFHWSTDECWRISEFNQDVPGGLAETAELDATVAAATGVRGMQPAGDLAAAITAALAPWPRIGLVHATAWSVDLQQVAAVARWLEAAGHATVIGSPANLQWRDGRPHLFDRPVDALFRHYPAEWIPGLPDPQAWLRVAQEVPCMNPLTAVVAESKRFHAAPAEHALGLSEATQATLARDFTRSCYPRAEGRDAWLAAREEWVLKRTYGRMGEGIRIGAALSAQAWDEALDTALQDPQGFVLQEFFEPAPLWFSHGMGYPVVGVFLVDGEFAGYHTRVSRHPVIQHDASYVPTMVTTA
ncbi:glutathionylspermidine synthase family protein [Thioalkalivibrio halophilus]|uniref:Glutathionylspermidine synthase pre-ATP-grasp-like domain-containing protein n=1 Tax=Thioalkalivibrio halophilus TaxID=252474 RepID=A0A1V2ZWJ5_9GAMM|nr:glutathionylspermidine synthase family protein [Thioalkalivibrio halophilus]OOC09498.1 hypothetical protein B1A74_10615 [Thioalkalivibrio halophilus]